MDCVLSMFSSTMSPIRPSSLFPTYEPFNDCVSVPIHTGVVDANAKITNAVKISLPKHEPSVENCSQFCGHGDDSSDTDEELTHADYADENDCKLTCKHDHSHFANPDVCKRHCSHSHSSFATPSRCAAKCGHVHDSFPCPAADISPKDILELDLMRPFFGANSALVFAFRLDVMFNADPDHKKDKRRRLPSQFNDAFLGRWKIEGHELKHFDGAQEIYTFPQPFYTVYITYF